MAAKIKNLVVSNDPAMLGFLPQSLDECGYHVITTQHTDGQLKETLDRELPDIVILDIMMPGLDGIEVGLRIRKWSQVPILMLSTWGAGEDKVRGLDLISDTYLTEPFGIEGVRERVEQSLQRNAAAMNLPSHVH
ncbi:response regulator transcription factor [Chloroflexota bacterium]